MKRAFLVLLSCTVAFSTWAQEVDSLQSSRRGDKDRLYYQLFVGANKSANEHLPWTEFTSYPFAGGAFVGIGKEWSSLWGWRAALGFDFDKGRNIPECEGSDTFGWKDIELWGDLTFDLTDLFSKKQNKKFNLKAFLGVGALWSWGYPKDKPLSYIYEYSPDNNTSLGTRAGLTATYKISDQVKLGAELSHLGAQDHFNGVIDHNFPFDGRTNLSVGVVWTPEKKKKPAPVVVMAEKVRTIPPLAMLIPEKEILKTRQLAGRSYLDFPVNETVIYPKYRNNPAELKTIRESIDKVAKDKDVEITSISLHGYASPESPYSNNTRLAKGRTAALKNYIQQRYKLPASVFQTDFTPEDWENLRAFVATCDNLEAAPEELKSLRGGAVDYVDDSVIEYKEELLNVIDNYMEEDAKEVELKKVGGGAPYRWLLKNVYPGLRHTDYIIEYVVKEEYEPKDARRLIFTHPEVLSLAEMYQVAKSYPVGSDGYYDALTIAANCFPQDETANLNAACACIQLGRLHTAREYLEKAGMTPQAIHAWGALNALEGNMAEAKALLKRSSAAGIKESDILLQQLNK